MEDNPTLEYAKLVDSKIVAMKNSDLYIGAPVHPWEQKWIDRANELEFQRDKLVAAISEEMHFFDRLAMDSQAWCGMRDRLVNVVNEVKESHDAK